MKANNIIRAEERFRRAPQQRAAVHMRNTSGQQTAVTLACLTALWIGGVALGDVTVPVAMTMIAGGGLLGR